MDSIILHRLHIYPLWLCQIFYFRAIDNWVMFKLTGWPKLSLNHSTSAHVKKSMHIGLLEHFERDKITKRSRDM